jgi:hypothetical protein
MNRINHEARPEYNDHTDPLFRRAVKDRHYRIFLALRHVNPGDDVRRGLNAREVWP